MDYNAKGIKCAFLILLLFIGFNAVTRNTTVAAELTKNEYARQLVNLSGMQQQLSLIPDAIQAGFKDAEQDLSITEQRRLKQQVASAFAQSRLENVVLDTLVSELSEEEFQYIISWYNADLGKKISKLEVQRSSLSTPSQRDDFFQALEQHPPDDARVKALTELDHAWKITDASVSLMLDMQVAVSAALMSRMPLPDRLSLSKLLDSVERQRESLVLHYSSDTLLSMLFVYEQLTLSELNDYRQFAMSSTGHQFVKAINLALHKAMLEGSYFLGLGLGEIADEVNSPVM